MANRIKPLRRTGSTGQPNIANMQEGEIAVNSYDQKIWMRVGSNLVEIANASTPSGGGGDAPFSIVPITSTGVIDSTHLNSMCEKTAAGNMTMTVPQGLGEPGDAIFFVNNSASGDLVIGRAAGVSIHTYGSNANISIPTNRAALIVRTTTNDKWIRA